MTFVPGESGTQPPLPIPAGIAVPVLAAILANQGAPAAIASAWPIEVTDGANVLGVAAHPLRTDPTGATPQPVTESGAWNVGLNAGANLIGQVEVTDGANVLGTLAHPLRVDPTGTTPTPVTESGAWNVGLLAGTALVGQVSASDETSTVYNGTTALTPQFTVSNPSANGDSAVIAATGGKRIRVVAMAAVAAAAVNAFFRDGGGGSALTGTMDLAANGGFVLPYCPVGWFQTGVGNALDINLSAAQAVGLTFVYLLI